MVSCFFLSVSPQLQVKYSCRGLNVKLLAGCILRFEIGVKLVWYQVKKLGVGSEKFKNQPQPLLRPRSVNFRQHFRNLSHETVPVNLDSQDREPATGCCRVAPSPSRRSSSGDRPSSPSFGTISTLSGRWGSSPASTSPRIACGSPPPSGCALLASRPPLVKMHKAMLSGRNVCWRISPLNLTRLLHQPQLCQRSLSRANALNGCAIAPSWIARWCAALCAKSWTCASQRRTKGGRW